MSTVEVTTYTADDLLALPDGDRYELVDGQLLERMGTFESEWVANQLLGKLSDFCGDRKVGWCFGRALRYRCFEGDERRVRNPDVSFIRESRFTLDLLQCDYGSIAPDIAVQTITPIDTYGEMHDRVDEYLRAGTVLMWVIHTRTRLADVYRRNGSIGLVTESESLSGEEVLPSFECRLGDVLWPRQHQSSGTTEA